MTFARQTWCPCQFNSRIACFIATRFSLFVVAIPLSHRHLQQKSFMTRLSLALALLCQFVVLTASAAEMQYPMTVAAGPDGALYVSDSDAHSIWKIADGKREVFFQG